MQSIVVGHDHNSLAALTYFRGAIADGSAGPLPGHASPANGSGCSTCRPTWQHLKAEQIWCLDSTAQCCLLMAVLRRQGGEYFTNWVCSRRQLGLMSPRYGHGEHDWQQ